MEPLALCPWESPSYFIFSSHAYPFLYYSHLLPVLFGGILIAVLLVRNAGLPAIRILAVVFAISTIWILADIVSTATNRPDVVAFIWSIQVLIEPLLYAAALFLFYAFALKRTPSFREQLAIGIILAPLIILVPTSFTVQGIYLDACNAIEGFIASSYSYFVEIFLTLWIIIVATRAVFKATDKIERRKIVLFAIGLMAFLVSFASGNLIGSITQDWVTAQYGLFGLPIFTAFLGYLIVRFRVFDIKIFAAQALVVTVSVLVFSLLFIRTIQNVRLVTLVTFILSCVLGWFLVQSVKREIQLREEVEQLATNLSNANDKLKELDRLKSQFLSMASHDLRAPLTIIRNFVSLLLEGVYGKLAPAGEEGLHQVFERASDMAKSVETYLDVSRIEQGRMKYDFVDIEILPLIQNAVKAFTPNAETKGLKLTATYDPALEHAKAKIDVSKMNEVFNNLLDNTIKYTPKGDVNVSVQRKENTLRFVIKDTGVGMTPATLKNLFQLFSPGEDSKRVNPASTGVGLYVTKAHVEAHKGKVWAESEGAGKGSTFIVELPLLTV